MRSAYLVLGVPGNASPEDIETAYRRGCELFPPQRIANEAGAVDKFNEIRSAYAVLRDPQSREAHDRKLASAPAPRPARQTVHPVHEEPSSGASVLKWGIALVALLFIGGFYINYRNVEAKKLQAQVELAEKQKEQREAGERRREEEKAESERAQARARQEAEDRRFASEARSAAVRASYERQRSEQNALAQQRMAALEQQRQEQAARLEQQRAAAEARMRLEQDKRRIRDACYQLYRRYDC